MKSDEIRVVFSRRQLRAAVVVALLSASAYLMSENFTLSTYYPAPSGVYSQMVTTGNTYLARDPGGRVGIGTTSPGALLDVKGVANVVQLSLNGILLPAPPLGTQGLSWMPITVPGTPAQQTAIGYWNCNTWYTNSAADTCNGDTNGGYTCQPGENRTCYDVFDQGCAWGVRSVYEYRCVAASPTQTFYVLSASTVSAGSTPVSLVPVPPNKTIQSWNPLAIY